MGKDLTLGVPFQRLAEDMLNAKFITVLLGAFAMAALVEFEGPIEPAGNTKGCSVLQTGLSHDRVATAVDVVNESDAPFPDKVRILGKLANSLGDLSELTKQRWDVLPGLQSTTVTSTATTTTTTALPVMDGLAGHWDATVVENVTKLDGKVTKWGDISGNAYDLTSSIHPDFLMSAINGHPAVRFRGGSYLASQKKHPTYGKEPFTWFVVCQFPTFQSWKNIFSTNDNRIASNGNLKPVSMATDYMHQWGGGADVKYSTRLQANKVNVLVNFGEETFKRVVTNWNGGLVAPQGYVAMGRGMQNTGHYYDGYIGEAIAFSRALSDAQINAIIDHLQEKWTTPLPTE